MENMAVGLRGAPMGALSLRRGDRGFWEPEQKIAGVESPGQVPSGPCLARASWQARGVALGLYGVR